MTVRHVVVEPFESRKKMPRRHFLEER